MTSESGGAQHGRIDGRADRSSCQQVDLLLIGDVALQRLRRSRQCARSRAPSRRRAVRKAAGHSRARPTGLALEKARGEALQRAAYGWSRLFFSQRVDGLDERQSRLEQRDQLLTERDQRMRARGPLASTPRAWTRHAGPPAGAWRCASVSSIASIQQTRIAPWPIVVL